MGKWTQLGEPKINSSLHVQLINPAANSWNLQSHDNWSINVIALWLSNLTTNWRYSGAGVTPLEEKMIDIIEVASATKIEA